MTQDIFADPSYEQIALKKFGEVASNFRLYEAGWLGENPEEWDVMQVKGAQFRAAKTGKNKGKMTIMIPDTIRTVLVTRAEMNALNTNNH